MTETTPPGSPRAKRPTEHLAEAVSRLREQRRLSMTELAGRMTDLGVPMNRMAVQRLERGERKVDVDEVAVLARALGVPPLLLLFPVGVETVTEVLPGRTYETWPAAKWFVGLQPADEDYPLSPEWAITRLYEAHDREMEEFAVAHGELTLWPVSEDDPERGKVTRRARVALRNLRSTRAQMRRRHLVPPPLDDDIERVVETDTYIFMTPTELATLAAPLRQLLRPVGFSEDEQDEE